MFGTWAVPHGRSPSPSQALPVALLARQHFVFQVPPHAPHHPPPPSVDPVPAIGLVYRSRDSPAGGPHAEPGWRVPRALPHRHLRHEPEPLLHRPGPCPGTCCLCPEGALDRTVSLEVSFVISSVGDTFCIIHPALTFPMLDHLCSSRVIPAVPLQ